MQILIIIFSFVFVFGQYAYGVEIIHIDIGRGDVDVIYPSDYSEDKPLPVIIGLHGFTGNKRQLDNYWKLSRLVDHKNFILVYPQGTKDSKGRTFWNATEACCNMEHLQVDDAGYLMALLDTIEQKFPVDPDSIHFIGWSNGGFMSYRMACEHSDRIASFVSLAGANYEMEGVCANASPVHVLQVHGTEDAIVEYYDKGSMTAEKNKNIPGQDDKFRTGIRIRFIFSHHCNDYRPRSSGNINLLDHSFTCPTTFHNQI